MKRIVLPLVTFKVLVFTGAVLYGAGWVTPRSHTVHSAATEQRQSDTALRYRQNVSNHWHASQLQPDHGW